jgi:PAS domain S-box-containing protein
MSEATAKDQDLLIDLLTRMADCSSDMLAVLNSDLRFIAINEGYARMFGRPREYFPGKSAQAAFSHDPDHFHAVVEPLMLACLAGSEQLFERWIEVPGLGRLYLELRYRPLANADGKVTHLVVICRDRTEVMLSIEALQKSEMMLKRTEHIAKLGGWLFDVTTGDMQWTDEMYAIHEVGRDFIPTPANLASFISPEDQGKVRRDQELAQAGTPTSLTSQMTTARGVHKWVRSISFPVVQDGQVVRIEGVLQDITDLMEMQTSLQRAVRALESHKHILDKHAILAIADMNGNFKHVNDKFIEISEFSREELIGQPQSLMRTDLYPTAFYDELWSIIRSGEVWQGELSRKSRSGRILWVYITIVPVKDEHGKVEEFISVSTDLTELKQTEATLRRAQKMEAIGQLSGGIAHDFNNLLGIVVGNVELAELQVAPNHPAREPLENARNAALRGSVLTRRLLNFSRQSPLQGTVLDINRVLTNLDVLISKSLTALVSVEMRLDPMIGKVEVDAGDLEDAIINLAINAGDAMPEGGNLFFTTHNCVVEVTQYLNNIVLVPGHYVEIRVSDTGVGMSPEIMEKIFEPYFTTKPGEKGTGLGLSMVYGFVRRSKGFITVDSIPGKGSQFTMYLPVTAQSDKPATLQQEHRNEPLAAYGDETILLVDDEEAIVKVTTVHLQQLGYRVLSADNGEAALQLLQSGEKIDLLFTDIVMPGRMNGVELADAALALLPQLKVLLTTGYARVESQTSMERWRNRLLAKPYRMAELSRKIREMLDG